MENKLWMSMVELVQLVGAIAFFGWLIWRPWTPRLREQWRRRHSLWMQGRGDTQRKSQENDDPKVR